MFPISLNRIVDAVLSCGSTKEQTLHSLRSILFNGESSQLDHDPALVNRKKVYRNGVHVDYEPRANDPNYLFYRSTPSHDVKTRVRGDNGQFSDLMLAQRERNREKKKTKRKYRWAKGRKIQSRPFQKRVVR